MFKLRELVAQIDQQFSEASALGRGQSEKAAEVVVLGGIFLLGKIADNDAASGRYLGEDEEGESVHLVKQRFGCQEEFGHQTQVATIGRFDVALNLPNVPALSGVSVEFIARWVTTRAELHMAPELLQMGQRCQTEFTNVDNGRRLDGLLVGALIEWLIANKLPELDPLVSMVAIVVAFLQI